MRVDSDRALDWFCRSAPTLYHPQFGRQRTGPAFFGSVPAEPGAASSRVFSDDPRVVWEDARDQDLAAVAAAAVAAGWDPETSRVVEERLARFLTGTPPNAMEAALRCIAWLELSRFLAATGRLPAGTAAPLAEKLIETGRFIERKLFEVPLGGNHLLSHALGLLYLGRLLPGAPDADRWACRSRAILVREVPRQLRPDGGSHEQSTGYHLFSLELLLGATLLLRGQGDRWPPAVMERLHAGARFAAALLRPDGSVPILGDDDSGRLHRWGPDSRARELCAVAALIFDDPDLAGAAAGASTAAAWLCGADAAAHLEQLATGAAEAAGGQSFAATGLHVLRDGSDCHAAVWSRDPKPRAMLSHAHSDHGTVDLWVAGRHLLRDPGSGVYLGDPALRNRLRSTQAHSTLTIDGAEINPFSANDLFFMPPLTRGRRCGWMPGPDEQSVTVAHDGFRRLRGAPLHVRTVSLDRRRRELRIVDHLTGAAAASGERAVEAWWHWGDAPLEPRGEDVGGFTRWRFTVAGIGVELSLPLGSTVSWADPFPWSPRYGVVLPGVRTAIRYRGLLPFRMELLVSYP